MTSPSISRLRSGALWNILGSLVYAGCQWGILVATVKLSTGADAGRLSLGFAISAPVFLLLQLRLRAASATDATLAFTPSHYIRLRALCTVLALVVCWAICRITGLAPDTSRIVLLVALAKAIESGSDLMYGLMQQADNLRAIALSMILRGVLASAAFTVLIARTHRLDAALGGLCAAWLLVFLVMDLPTANLKSSGHAAGLSSLGRLAVLTFPLGLSTMLMSLMANMPRYFIEHRMGPHALGIFSAAGYLTMTVSIIISAMAESSIADMARLFAAGDGARAALVLRSVLFTTIVLSALSLIASQLFGSTILRIVYRSEYGEASTLLTVLMVAAAMANLSSVYGYALIAARRFHRYLSCLILSSLCTATACALLIPHWGTMGGALACVIGYTVQSASSFLLLRRDIASRRDPVSLLQPVAGY